jgi:hypothetical protein
VFTARYGLNVYIQFYVLPTQCIKVFCVDLRTNSDYFPCRVLCVYCAVRTECLITIHFKFSLQMNDVVRVTVVTVVDQLLIFGVSVPSLAENPYVSEERTVSFLKLSEPRSCVCG